MTKFNILSITTAIAIALSSVTAFAKEVVLGATAPDQSSNSERNEETEKSAEME